MLPVKQEFKHDPENGTWGDCYRAAVASLLELPLVAVPHFCYGQDEDGTIMRQRVAEFCKDSGFVQFAMPVTSPSVTQLLENIGSHNPETYFLLGGKSANGTNHIVVCKGSKIVHDPAQDDSGITGPCEPDDCYWIELFYPAINAKQSKGGSDD